MKYRERVRALITTKYHSPGGHGSSAWVGLWLLLGFGSVHIAAQGPVEGPFLFHGLSFHGDRIAFACAGRIWLVAGEGGTAVPLTDASGDDRFPVFSPDGAYLAFMRSNSQGGDLFVYEIALEVERRLSHHPSRDLPLSWSRDGQRILFASNREGFAERLYELDIDGRLPQPLALPNGYEGCFTPDGNRLAYLPTSSRPELREFRFYRGGMNGPLLIADLESGKTQKVTDGTSRVHALFRMGEHLYFIDDRDGTDNLYAYRGTGMPAEKLTSFQRFGVRSAAGNGGTVVLERDGFLYKLDPVEKRLSQLPLALPLDFSLKRERTVNAREWVQSMALAHDGKTLTVTARGDVFRFEPQTGKARNLTATSGTAERDAVPSPDGKWLAFFSDASGEYRLHLYDVADGSAKAFPIEDKPSFYRELAWSPDSRKLSFSDQRLGLRYFDLTREAAVLIDRSEAPEQDRFHASWSPNGHYLAYEIRGKNRLPGIAIYDTQTGQNHRVTEGIHAQFPVFDPGGRYLYFASSPNAAASDFRWSVLTAALEEIRIVRDLNAVILQAGGIQPVLPGIRQSNLEVDWESQNGGMHIDFQGIGQRIVPLGIDPVDIRGLWPVRPGDLLVLANTWPESPGISPQPRSMLYRFNLRAPARMVEIARNVDAVSVSGDGSKLLYRGDSLWNTADLDNREAQHRQIRMRGLPAPVDSETEWRQIFDEAVRLMRDYFYDPNHHGQSMDELKRHFEAYLPGVSSRAELNELLERMLGSVSVSHFYVAGGDLGRQQRDEDPIGMLGADFTADRGRYRFQRVLSSGPFADRNPLLRAPLDQPGSRVAEGEYLLAVDDMPIHDTRNIYSYFVNKASLPVRLTVGPHPDGNGSRTVTVVTLSTEAPLRRANWVETNRQTVAELSGGRLGYLYIGAHNAEGLENFMRDYYAAGDKEGLVIDQRFNGGGITPDALVNLLRRESLYTYMFRHGRDLPMPVHAFTGPKVMLINQWNASAAETFALMFQLGKMGSLVGMRTFGGGIGPHAWRPDLIDGGTVQIPNRAAYDPSGEWGIENRGVVPDLTVPLDLASWRSGIDSQLHAAVRQAMAELDKKTRPSPKRPPFPVYR